MALGMSRSAMTTTLFWTALLSLVLATCCSAQIIHLQSGSVNVKLTPKISDHVPARDRDHDFRMQNEGYFEDRQLYLVTLQHPITEDVKEVVREITGDPLRSYLPDDTYMIFTTPEQARKAKSAKGVVWVGDYLPEYKISKLMKAYLEKGPEDDLRRIIVSLSEVPRPISASNAMPFLVQFFTSSLNKIIKDSDNNSNDNNNKLNAHRLSNPNSIMSIEEEEEEAREWERREVAITAVGTGRVNVMAQKRDFPTIIDWLSKRQEVVFIEPQPIHHFISPGQHHPLNVPSNQKKSSSDQAILSYRPSVYSPFSSPSSSSSKSSSKPSSSSSSSSSSESKEQSASYTASLFRMLGLGW